MRAFETTTARLLGAETGYSDESAAPATALVEAAMTNALDNVMSRINSYWQDDIKNGLQYKVIVTHYRQVRRRYAVRPRGCRSKDAEETL